MMPAQALKPGSTRPHWAAHTEVEISLGIGLEIETESMKALGGIPVIVKILKKISLPIVVEIMEAGDLIVTNCIDFSIDDLQPEGLVQPSGKPFPLEVLQIIVDTRNDPNIPVPCTDSRGLSIVKEIKSPYTHAWFVLVIEGDSEGINHIGIGLIFGNFSLYHKGISPLGISTLSQSTKICCPASCRLYRWLIGWIARPECYLSTVLSGRNPQQSKTVFERKSGLLRTVGD